MARRALRAVFAVTAIAVVVIIALWILPGFLAVHTTGCPLHMDHAGRVFCVENTAVGEQQCTPGVYCPSPTPFSFQGVSFLLLLVNRSGGPYLSGFVNESNGVFHSFGLVGDPLGPSSLNWTSPDEEVLIAWHAPFTETDSNGLLLANVTCGVYLG